MSLTGIPETPRIELVPAAAEHAPILANLLELYAHDFSEFYPIDLGGDGRYGYKHLPKYWSEPDHHAFLLRVNGALAGFALVKRAASESDGKPVWDMAEFFVTRAYRRHGIGMRVAHDVWRKFPGPWEVRVMEPNRAGVPFWRRAIAAYYGGEIVPTHIEKDGRNWLVFSFESKAVLREFPH